MTKKKSKKKARATVKRKKRPAPATSLRAIRDTLPDRPSALLRVAIRDLQAAERSGYEIDMGIWHRPDSATLSFTDSEIRADRASGKSKHCAVCMAGSVLACSLNASADLYMADPFEATRKGMPASVRDKLLAINDLREGNVADALRSLGIEQPRLLTDSVIVRDYAFDKEDFFEGMEELASELERVGL